LARQTAEQRTETRLAIRLQVEYDALDEFLDDYTANLSLGGMFVERDEPFPVGTRFKLRLRVPHRERPIETFGTVRWVNNAEHGTPGMGIQFDPLRPGIRREVEAALDSLRTDASV